MLLESLLDNKTICILKNDIIGYFNEICKLRKAKSTAALLGELRMSWMHLSPGIDKYGTIVLLRNHRSK